MNSFVLIELDTTAPNLEIYAPKYTTRELENHITIESNERLGTFQEIYVMDSDGFRHDYTFLLEENKLIGTVKFNDFPLGVATLYVRVKDEVDNVSELQQFQFEVKDNISRLKLDISHTTYPLNISSSTREVNLIQCNRKVNSEVLTKPLGTDIVTREIIINTEI